MKLVQIASGINGTRQLAAAFAEVKLRKRGLVPKIKDIPHGTQKPWSDNEYDTAVALRLAGKSSFEIGAEIGRTEHGVNRMIGHEYHCRWERERALRSRRSPITDAAR
jgi:hypothetical protein